MLRPGWEFRLVAVEDGNRRKSIGPDILVALGVPAGRGSRYLVWREGKVPHFVMEPSSPDLRQRDRTDKRERYESLGVGRYFPYDPGYGGGPCEMRPYRLWGGEEEVRRAVPGCREAGEQVRERNLRTGKDVPWLLDLARDMESGARARQPAERQCEAAEARVAEPELLRAAGPEWPPRDGLDGSAGS